MSAPRQVLPGSTYLVTRRCAHRAFLLSPGPATNRVITYCLAEAALRTGVEVHACVAMSNHVHLVVSDPAARLPEFLQRLDRHIACCMNALLGRTENLWAATEPSVVVLADAEDALDKMAYVIANPVAAGLVADPSEWPGVITTDLRSRLSAHRPDVFFSAKGRLPESLELVCALPPGLAHLGDERAAEQLAARVRRLVSAAREHLAQTGREFLGRAGALAGRSAQVAATPEPTVGRSPRLAARDPAQRQALIARLRAFHRAYRAAFLRWRAGVRDVLFPLGTYAIRVLHGVECVPASAAAA